MKLLTGAPALYSQLRGIEPLAASLRPTGRGEGSRLFSWCHTGQIATRFLRCAPAGKPVTPCASGRASRRPVGTNQGGNDMSTTTNQITHIKPNTEAGNARLAALNDIADFYFKIGRETPAALFVAKSLVVNGVFGSAKEQRAQVIWVDGLIKQQTEGIKSVLAQGDKAIPAELLDALRQRYQVTELKPKPAPRKRATAKKSAPKKEV